MAGYVYIAAKGVHPSEAVGFSLGSLNLMPIAIYTRNKLRETSPEIADEVFKAYEYMQIIDLHALPPQAFMRFYAITISAHHYFREDTEKRELDKEYIEGICAHWRRLIGLLEADPRFSGSPFLVQSR